MSEDKLDILDTINPENTIDYSLSTAVDTFNKISSVLRQSGVPRYTLELRPMDKQMMDWVISLEAKSYRTYDEEPEGEDFLNDIYRGYEIKDRTSARHLVLRRGGIPYAYWACFRVFKPYESKRFKSKDYYALLDKKLIHKDTPMHIVTKLMKDPTPNTRTEIFGLRAALGIFTIALAGKNGTTLHMQTQPPTQKMLKHLDTYVPGALVLWDKPMYYLDEDKSINHTIIYSPPSVMKKAIMKNAGRVLANLTRN